MTTIDRERFVTPELTPEDIRACLSYAAARESHEVRLTAAA